jgi:glycosyltransferase involved in cell wall biosynthesis
MPTTITVIIPACDAAAHLPRCLEALRGSLGDTFETIVVDDGSKDATLETAAAFGATALSTGRRMGPSFARNLAARAAKGSVLLFLDSDVCVRADTVSQVRESFEADSQLDALMGSYDSNPASQDFLSQYRNLMHAYVHQTGADRASTFWSGCGAIRRSVFLENSGFNETYGRPAVEDIELGYRLIQAGKKIVLDRSIQVTHLKRWTFWNLVKTDILDRGIPWTELILRDRCMPNDLNLQLSQRVSVALVFILVALAGALAIMSGAYLLIPPLAILFFMLGYWWGGEVRINERPRRAFAILSAMIFLIALLAYWRRMYGLIPPLLASPALLITRHRYSQEERSGKTARWFAILYIFASVCVAIYYLPSHPLVFACFTVLLLLGVMNSQFYTFLAGKRGPGFMLAAIPFHLLYHFYNGLSFIAGTMRYYWGVTLQPSGRARTPLTPRTIREPAPASSPPQPSET